MTMHIRYIFIPKNPNLNHCPESFHAALKCNSFGNSHIKHINHITLGTILYLVKNLVDLSSSEVVSLFFFQIRLEYLALIFILKTICTIISKDLRVYYMMHEPRLEKGRTNPIKAYLVHISNLLFGFLSYKVLLPSNEAVLKAKNFVENQKISQVNLTFMSIPDETLEKNLFELKCNWENFKTFSYLGTVVKDKNPQGFIKLAYIVNKYYVDKARFIRAGSDKNVSINYDEELIIRFPGYMSNSAKKFLLGLTHFVVIPYSFSTQSGVIAEALSYGKLLVINDIPAFSCFKNLEFVFLIDFNDEMSILKCINYLFSMDVSDYEKRYREAVSFFQKNYSVSYLSKTLSKVL